MGNGTPLTRGGADACISPSLCFSEGMHSWLGLCGARSSNQTRRDRRLPLLQADRPEKLFPLCVFDPHPNTDDSHRRDWFFRRLKALAEHFAIDVLAYAILSNRFHLVLRNRPDLVAKMSDREVVTAWLMICPK